MRCRPRRNHVPSSEGVKRGHETVLVAEDEEAVRQLAIQSLERNGYQVIAAASGEEALTLASSYDGTIHLLLTDVVMPGMKGPELAARLRALRPGVKVLLMSGYAADVVTPEDLRDATMLSKPFSPSALSSRRSKRPGCANDLGSRIIGGFGGCQ